MEALLAQIDVPAIELQPHETHEITVALQNLVQALKSLRKTRHDAATIAALSNDATETSSSSHTATTVWLLDLLATVPSALDTPVLAAAVWDAAQLPAAAQQQAALFDALGASEPALAVLLQVAPRLAEIRQVPWSAFAVTSPQNAVDRTDYTTTVDIVAERRTYLVQDARHAQAVADWYRAELEQANAVDQVGDATTTHLVQRASDQKLRKELAKAQRQAEQAWRRAQQAGAVMDPSVVLRPVAAHVQPGPGGLQNYSAADLQTLQHSLLPAHAARRQHYDPRGLPPGTIRERRDDCEYCLIPPVNASSLLQHDRLVIADIMNATAARAFAGTTSLNPLQSAVFDVAFHRRDNMLVCAPTGAGKTNVAMLTVVQHLQSVGRMPGRNHDGEPHNTVLLETGHKVVYIAPMKALAQEVVAKFAGQLQPLGLMVRELTGDMQLTRAEQDSADILVTTPEKWDVVTRKSGNDPMSLGHQCGLLIIDEVHLLADDRGAVIESVVARHHRLVESSQRQLRIVGLSATLPNYEDVAEFLQVSSDRGLFYFGPEHRPVPLQQQFYGVKVHSRDRQLKEKRMNELCFDVVLDALKRGYQAMVFVHSRRGTGDTAKALAELASDEQVLESHFVTQGKDGVHGDANKRFADRVKKSRNREVQNHFDHGIGIHHAGMLRGDRKLTEQMFNDGAIKVLCCTATLAWGINLPAHTVVIKGTEVYNPEKGGITDLSILDVQQIFGRAGRPQFDKSGEATLITSEDAFKRYMDKLVRAVPIESNFIKQLPDHLNAEISGRTVTDIAEGVAWLRYTYLYIRMMRNPLAYGINADQKRDDPRLDRRCNELISDAARLLAKTRMIGYHPETGNLSIQEQGRIASNFYIQAESIETFNDTMRSTMTDADLCMLVCSAAEFQNMKIRQEELSELGDMVAQHCPFPIKGAGRDDAGHGLITSPADKAYVLLQVFVSRAKITSFTLISDTNYIASNLGRVARALFEICLAKQWGVAAARLHRISVSAERRVWWFQTPLRQFEDELKSHVYTAIENSSAGNRASADMFASALSLNDMTAREVGQLAKWAQGGEKIQSLVSTLPNMTIDCTIRPVTSSVVLCSISIFPTFEWSKRWHGSLLANWLWVENDATDKILHHEHFVFSHRTFPSEVSLEFYLPIFEPTPRQYVVRVLVDSWSGVEFSYPVPLADIELPTKRQPHTDLLDLAPLPVSALNDERYEKLYTKFEVFNPVQTQLFHVLYHTDSPVLLGAPTGSGKTIVAELAVLRMKKQHPKGICVYIAPLKSLARERLKEWRARLGSTLGWSILELSGDTSHDQRVIEKGDVLICTPEKWDLVSRSWTGQLSQNIKFDTDLLKTFVARVRLLVIDEVHLLGEDRGAVLEAIVSRTRFISQLSEDRVGSGVGTRIVALSTAVENPLDIADWIGIDVASSGTDRMRGMYNFRPSIRPVPMRIAVQGFSGRQYCPRMASMNKPCYSAIKEISPDRPTLIFVASRRQTRLTALDLISFAAGDGDPKRFSRFSEMEADAAAQRIHDKALRHTITFGIGLHHAGLSSRDRDIVESMFLDGKLLVLVATATLAWGVNLPAHLVIIKGTEYFDGKLLRYVDYPLTDVLQMSGRAGRPGFDTQGHALVMAMEDKKLFLRRFLHSPFPVESCLGDRLCETINAEIAGGTVSSVVDVVGYLTWTFLARRVKANPTFYGAASSSEEDVESRLLEMVTGTLDQLAVSECVVYDKDMSTLTATKLGTASAKFYLLHETPKQMWLGVQHMQTVISQLTSAAKKKAPGPTTTRQQLAPLDIASDLDNATIAGIFYTLACTHEFDELPVRPTEEDLNQELAVQLSWGADANVSTNDHPRRQVHPEIYEDPHTKAFLLLQAYMEHAELPISDYVTDTRSVIDNVPRLLAAMEFIVTTASGDLDNAAAAHKFDVLTQVVRARQVFYTRCKVTDDPLRQLPGINDATARKIGMPLRQLRCLGRKQAAEALSMIRRHQQDATLTALYRLPLINIKDVVPTSVDKAGMTSIAVELQVERESSSSSNQDMHDNDITVSVLVGSEQGLLLTHTTVRLASRTGKWSVHRSLTWDSELVAKHAPVIVRIVHHEVRGLDAQAPLP